MRTVKVTEVVTYQVKVQAEDAQAAEDAAIDRVIEEGDEHFMAVIDRYAEVQD